VAISLRLHSVITFSPGVFVRCVFCTYYILLSISMCDLAPVTFKCMRYTGTRQSACLTTGRPVQWCCTAQHMKVIPGVVSRT
jgi:hypothetical protein